MGTMPYTFFLKADSGYNQAIGREQAFYLSDTQIQVYPAVPPGGYDIVGSKILDKITSERRYPNRSIRYMSMALCISSYSFIT